MAIKFAEQKIQEARRRVAALDRELTELPQRAWVLGDDHPLREARGCLLQERLKAFLELLQLLELADMPPDEMGSA